MKYHGYSHPLTERRATGHDAVVTIGTFVSCSTRSPGIFPPPRRWFRDRAIFRNLGLGAEPGSPNEGECATNQVPMATNSLVRAHHEIRPPQLVFDLLVSLLEVVSRQVV